MAKDLTGLFSPKSVAVIGASNSPEKVGAIVLKNIVDSGYQGKIYPVNPKETQIAGLQCFSDVKSLPEVPDLAVFAIPSTIVNNVLDEIGQKGIKNAVIFSAGFKEIGEEGALLQKRLEEIANRHQINVLGPNCLGFANNNLPINVTFGQMVKEKGNLRIISQSGAIAASLFDWCQTTKLGFGEFVTIGNKAVVTENDVLDYWASLSAPVLDQPGLSKVSPIGLYLESIADGQEFVKIASKISQNTPIFALKPGKSKAAVSAMQSHTGAIAGEDSVLDTALKQSGIVRCQDLSDFFDLARAFAWENVPMGPRVAIVSNAGGPAVLSTDSINEVGLEMARFSQVTQQKLGGFLPRMASFLNPVDVLGDALADRFGQAIEAVLLEPTVDAAIVILTPQMMTQIEKTAEIIGRLSAQYPKPILCSFIGGSLATVGEKILNDYKIPTFPFPEMAIKTLSLMWQWQNWRATQVNSVSTPELSQNLNTDKIKNIISSAKKNFQKSLDNFEANDALSSVGIATPPSLAVGGLEQAEKFATENGWPVVLKLSSPRLLHKSDSGGVITHIKNTEELKSSWVKITGLFASMDPETKMGAKIQIQKEIVGGIEVIVGVKRDSNFGQVMLFGAGGKLAEIMGDRSLHLLPLQTREAHQMVESSKIFTLLKGFRGDSPYNLDKLYETITRLGNLASATPEITEIEINPLIITHEGVWAVDCKVLFI
jgi:acetyl coenzyme A synthetase (ADP forming)-like protein